MGDDGSQTLEYEPDEGYVRLNLRRPVNIYVPTDKKDSYDPHKSSKEPSNGLEIEWVHGYRGRDCRNNVLLLASGEITYFVAAVTIIYNRENKTQRHYVEHQDDIKCIAVHPNGKIVATGQVKGKGNVEAEVRIWDSESLNTLHVIGADIFNRGVSCLAFNHEDGDLLAAVDDSPEPRISVWSWSNEKVVAESKASSDFVLGVIFSKEFPSRVVTFGKSHLAFWTLSEEGELKKSNGIFGDIEKPKFIITAASLISGDVVTGDSSGNILRWKTDDNEIKSVVETAHEDGIFCISVTEDGKVLSGGKDNKVFLYDDSLTPTGQFLEVPKEHQHPRAVVLIDEDIFIGTTGNSLMQTSVDGEIKVITQGHEEELWGLATHPSSPHFITAGQDKQVHYRNAESNEILWTKTLDESCQSADISPVNNMVVIGTVIGKWYAIDLEENTILFEGCNGEEALQMVKFSPSGEHIALGSRDNQVYIYSVEEGGEKFSSVAVCEGHSSFITHLDWSANGQVIRTNSGDYELLYWNAEDGSQIVQAEDTKDLKWATNSCILSFETVGIWPDGTDGTDINSANKGNNINILASGDDFGHVKLFSFPATLENAAFKMYNGHSSHVTSVSFLFDDSKLISIGGRDTAVIQWKVV